MNTNKTETKVAINLSANKIGSKIQIALPKLCNYASDDEEDEDEKEAASMVINKSSSQSNINKPTTGLLSFLPQPKANQFINNKLNKQQSNKLDTVSSSSSLLLPRTLQPNAKKSVSILDEDDAIRQRNFKRFKVDDKNTENVGRNLVPKKFIADYKDFEEQDPEIKFNDEEDSIEKQEFENKPEDYSVPKNSEKLIEQAGPELNEEALMKLCGKKHSKEAIQLMNVKANDIMGDNRSSLMKQITKEYKPPNNRDYFGSGSKKTHQITYLAFVAKERDQELRDTWAQNKFNKTQARQKYGF